MSELARKLAIEQGHYPADGPPVQHEMDRPAETDKRDEPIHG